MQLYQLQPGHRSRKSRRVGRGGKRGTYSGRGQKGQKARSAGLGADFRGGNRPLWKVFPKKRGSRKKTQIKRRFFQSPSRLVEAVNLEKLDKHFAVGETVNLSGLKAKKLVRTSADKVKILGRGSVTKKLSVVGLKISASAREKIIKADGKVEA